MLTLPVHIVKPFFPASLNKILELVINNNAQVSIVEYDYALIIEEDEPPILIHIATLCNTDMSSFELPEYHFIIAKKNNTTNDYTFKLSEHNDELVDKFTHAKKLSVERYLTYDNEHKHYLLAINDNSTYYLAIESDLALYETCYKKNAGIPNGVYLWPTPDSLQNTDGDEEPSAAMSDSDFHQEIQHFLRSAIQKDGVLDRELCSREKTDTPVSEADKVLDKFADLAKRAKQMSDIARTDRDGSDERISAFREWLLQLRAFYSRDVKGATDDKSFAIFFSQVHPILRAAPEPIRCYMLIILFTDLVVKMHHDDVLTNLKVLTMLVATME